MEDPRTRTVLVADSDPRSVRYVTRCLRGSGYGVALAESPVTLLMAEAREQPVAVLVDDAMPGSVEAVRRLREASEVPILLLSFENEALASAALRVGADTVVMKPFSAELLIAHIESLLRRLQDGLAAESEHKYSHGSLHVDFATRMVTVHELRVHLSAREYRLLQVLATNAGRVLTHEQLLRLVWGPGYEESSDLLRGYIRNLRRKIGDDARHPELVYTESQVGYWMERSQTAVHN